MGFDKFDNKFSWWAKQNHSADDLTGIPKFGRTGMPANTFMSRSMFMGLGSGLGFYAAYSSGLFDDPTDPRGHLMAAAGGLAGLAASSVNWEKVQSGVLSGAWSGAKASAKPVAKGLWGLARFATKGSLGVTSFITKRPGVSMSLAGLAVGLGALALSGNRTSNASAETLGMIAAASGDGSLPSTGYDWGESGETRQRGRFLSSTEGLVQGLHTARHRG